MNNKRTNHPYLTAIKRTAISAPSRILAQRNLLKGRILDFGCGYGFDTDYLKEKGFDIVGYDNYYRKDYPEGKFDTIICNYVLNVLEPYEQAEVMMEVSSLLNPDGTAYFAVRRDLMQDGFRWHAIHKEYTYQCTVHLPYTSIFCNDSFELYAYQLFNRAEPHGTAGCVFCNLAKRLEVICETATCVAFFDGYPVSPGHALIIPKRHVASYFDLTNREREAMNVMLQFVKRKLDERFHPDGYNIGINVGRAGGQTVFHCHMHIIPRYKGDVEDPKGGVRGVIPAKQKYSSVEGQPNRMVYAEETVETKDKTPTKKLSYMEKSKALHGNAYQPWDDEADALLCKMYDETPNMAFLSEVFERSRGGIRSRLKKLGKLEEK